MKGELLSWFKGARKDPGKVLVKLFSLVREDQLLYQRALNKYASDNDEYKNRIEKLFQFLAGDHLSKIPAIIDEDILAALRAVDRHLAERYLGYESTPLSVTLDRRKFWIIRRPPGWRSLFSHVQSNHLVFWLRNHWVIPANYKGVRISIVEAPALLAYRLRLQTSVRAYVGGFPDSSRPVWETQAPRYGCSVLDDTEKQWKLIKAALEDARQVMASIVVLPELTVCPKLRQRVQDWLREEEHSILLTVPGSFHLPSGAFRISESVLLDFSGRILFRHGKLVAMMVEYGGDPTRDVYEDIRPAEELTLLATPIGLLAIGICIDFCDESEFVSGLWTMAGPELALVPSMSNQATLEAHRRRAHALCRSHGTCTALALQPIEEKDGSHGSCYGLVVAQREEFSADCIEGSPEQSICRVCVNIQFSRQLAGVSGLAADPE